MNRVLARNINAMAREDQKMRKSFEKTGPWNDGVDRSNTAKLKKIIKKYGWPTIPLVGEKANTNAWLLAQHADHDRNFQRSVLKLLIAISPKKNIKRAHIAYLTDRLLVAEKKPQIFGTQFSFDKKKKLRLSPLKTRRNINKLRKSYGLPTLGFHLKEAQRYNARKI